MPPNRDSKRYRFPISESCILQFTALLIPRLRLLGQEGIGSLEPAFLLAGAKSAIESLSPADDTFTVVLMKRMYQHLADGDAKGVALRQAKLDLLKEFGDQARPIYWAGFSLVGDGSRRPIGERNDVKIDSKDRA
jgi:hypothetical protein